MPVPHFDTRTPLEPLRERIQARVAEVIGSGRTHLALPMSPVLSPEQAAEVAAAIRHAGLGRPH